MLLDAKADFSSADSNGATALHYAAQNNHAKTVEVKVHSDPTKTALSLENLTKTSLRGIFEIKVVSVPTKYKFYFSIKSFWIVLEKTPWPDSWHGVVQLQCVMLTLNLSTGCICM